MSSLYDRAEIYDLLESEKRNEAARRDWQGFLGGRSIRTAVFKERQREENPHEDVL